MGGPHSFAGGPVPAQDVCATPGRGLPRHHDHASERDGRPRRGVWSWRTPTRASDPEHQAGCQYGGWTRAPTPATPEQTRLAELEDAASRAGAAANYILQWKMMSSTARTRRVQRRNSSADAWRPARLPYQNYTDEGSIHQRTAIVNSVRTGSTKVGDHQRVGEYAKRVGPLTRATASSEDSGRNCGVGEIPDAVGQQHATAPQDRRGDVCITTGARRGILAAVARGVGVRDHRARSSTATRPMWHAWNVDRLYTGGVRFNIGRTGTEPQKSVIRYDRIRSRPAISRWRYSVPQTGQPSATGKVEQTSSPASPRNTWLSISSSVSGTNSEA